MLAYYGKPTEDCMVIQKLTLSPSEKTIPKSRLRMTFVAGATEDSLYIL